MTIVVPVALPKMQSLNWGVNLQAQYLAPDQSFYNPWQLSRSLKRKPATNVKPESDYSREFIYSLIESVMNRWVRLSTDSLGTGPKLNRFLCRFRHRKNGRACLQRAICEVSQHPLSGNGHGFIGHIADAIFIPPKGSTSVPGDVYYAAHLAGVAGVDCLHQFPECPPQDGILERMSILL